MPEGMAKSVSHYEMSEKSPILIQWNITFYFVHMYRKVDIVRKLTLQGYQIFQKKRQYTGWVKFI